MSFQPKIIAYVCNWCTYLGADLAGTNRLEYPPNVRIIRLPCTGRIDFNLIVKGFEAGADSILVSGCHPGDCHYNAGNYHARRRWMLFRPLLETLGFDMRRIHFTWISAAEGRKFQQVMTEITEATRALGPANYLQPEADAPDVPRAAASPAASYDGEAEMRAKARELLASGEVKVAIGYSENGTPVFVTEPEGAERLAWNSNSKVNLAGYLRRPDIRSLGRAAVVAGPATLRALNVLEIEEQIDRAGIVEIPVTMPPRPPNWKALDDFLALSREERFAYWADELSRCVKCYACRAACPLCYCERCIADKNRPTVIDTSPTLQGNFAWHITRAFHQAARCAGCGECVRACPAGINFGLLNMTLARAALEEFDYRAGAERHVQPVIGCYSLEDKEEFIR